MNILSDEVVQTVLIVGATGYIGSRVLRRLLGTKHKIRCLARRPEFLSKYLRDGDNVEAVQGDLLNPVSLQDALKGVDTVFYFAHSLGSSVEEFQDVERICALNFAEAAQKAKIKKIIYLGGLAPEVKELSNHMKSRHEVGRILRLSNAIMIEFRASIIIGSGSISYDIIKALTERLPIMILPKWVRVQAQPIFVDDVLDYLLSALGNQFNQNRIYEIGGKTQLSYKDLMLLYAKLRGLKRYMISVPFLTPSLSSLWLGLVTPVYARIGRKLIDSLLTPTTVCDFGATLDFPHIHPISIEEALKIAQMRENNESPDSYWNASVSSGKLTMNWDGTEFRRRIFDVKTAVSKAPAEITFKVIESIGGDNGWYYGDFLWQIRGILDKLVGGVGMRKGRKNPDTINIGDPLDFWRVADLVPNKRLLLEAEMKLPGRAWLEFTVEPNSDGTSMITQRAIFDPVGLWGELYWYSLCPLHKFIFQGMIDGIAKKAQKLNI